MNILQKLRLDNAADARHPVATGPNLRTAYYRDRSIWNGRETLEELDARVESVLVDVFLPYDDTDKYVLVDHPVYGGVRALVDELELIESPRTAAS